MKSPVLLYHEEHGLKLLHLAAPSPLIAHIRIAVLLPDTHQKNKILLGFYADMLEKGSKRFSKDAYEETLESLGADVAVDSGGNTLQISVVARTSDIPKVLSVLRATFDAPLFKADEIQKLKKEYKQAFHEAQNDTRHLASALFSRNLYDASALEYIPTLSERESLLESIDKKKLQEIHASLGAGSWSLTVAGTKKVFADARRFVCVYVDVKAPERHDIEERLLPVPANAVLEHVPGKQNIELYIGNHVPLVPSDPEYTAFAFGIDVLGKRGGFAGRLMSTVREKEGLTYSIYSWLSGADSYRSGYAVIWTFFTPRDIQKGLASTMREVRKIYSRGVTDAEVAQFKILLSNQFTLAFESVRGTVGLYHSALTKGLLPEFVESYPKRVRALTKGEVNAALRAHLNPDALVVAAAGTLEKPPSLS